MSNRVTKNGGGSTTGYTGDLIDSAMNKIATVVSGLITSVVYSLGNFYVQENGVDMYLLENGVDFYILE